MIRIGLIGAGAVGQMHLSFLAQQKNCELVALADLRPDLGRLVAEKFELPHVFQSHQAMLEKKLDLDAAWVVSHRHQTSAIVSDCLKANLHVFTEKPLAMNSEHGQKLVNEAKKRNLKLAVGYQRQSDEGTLIALEFCREAAASGQYGPISFARFWNFTGKDRDPKIPSLMTKEERTSGLNPWPIMPQWMPEALALKFKLNYDRFVNVVCHDINLMNLFFPEFKEPVFAELENPLAQSVLLRTKNTLIQLSTGFHELSEWDKRLPWDEGFELRFQSATLTGQVCAPLIHTDCTRVELITNRGREVLHSGKCKNPSFENEIKNFLAAIETKTPITVDGEKALRDLELIDQIWRKMI